MQGGGHWWGAERDAPDGSQTAQASLSRCKGQGEGSRGERTQKSGLMGHRQPPSHGQGMEFHSGGREDETWSEFIRRHPLSSLHFAKTSLTATRGDKEGDH